MLFLFDYWPVIIIIFGSRGRLYATRSNRIIESYNSGTNGVNNGVNEDDMKPASRPPGSKKKQKKNNLKPPPPDVPPPEFPPPDAAVGGDGAFGYT